MIVQIISGGLDRADVRSMLSEHLDDMFATSPAESVHALDIEALRGESVSFWTVVDTDGAAIAVGALAELSDTDAELKSMRTASAARGRGVAASLLAHVIDAARERGYVRVRLETGSEDFFAPARRLYERHGFVETGPFGRYTEDPNSRFYLLSLDG